MDKSEAREIFRKVLEVAGQQPTSASESPHGILSKFPTLLQRTLQEEISDPLEREAASLLRLQKTEGGNFRVILCEAESEKHRLVELYRKFVHDHWQARDFAQVVKLCQVALVFDPNDPEISCFLGRAKWEMDEVDGLDFVRQAAERDRKFLPVLERIVAEKASRDKLSLKMASGIFSDDSVRRAKLSALRNREQSLWGRISRFFVVSGVLLFFVALILAILIE